MKSTKLKRVAIDMPFELYHQINEACKETFVTKRKWFIDASQEKLKKEIDNKIDKIVRG